MARLAARASVPSGERWAACCVPVAAPATRAKYRAMARLAMIAAASLLLIQTATACKNCVVLGKAEKAMFRAHSAACQAASGAAPALADALLAGRATDQPALRRHVYCVLLKCKVVGKDGKLLKSAVLGKLAARGGGRDAAKALEQCADQSAHSSGSPEDVAWNLFRCGYDRKAVLFDYMPTDTDE